MWRSKLLLRNTVLAPQWPGGSLRVTETAWRQVRSGIKKPDSLSQADRRTAFWQLAKVTRAFISHPQKNPYTSQHPTLAPVFSWHPNCQGITWHLRLLTFTLGKMKKRKGRLERKWASTSSDGNDARSYPSNGTIWNHFNCVLYSPRPQAGIEFLGCITMCCAGQDWNASEWVSERASEQVRASVYTFTPHACGFNGTIC